MIIASQKLILKLTHLSLYIQLVLTQRLPPNNCRNLFQYERRGNQWIGHVTPTQDGLTDVTWKLSFVSHGVDQPGDISSLQPYPDKDTALQRMSEGGRGETFVRFEDYQEELPKIIGIELNGKVLCSASEYEAPSRTSTRQLQMIVSSTTSSGFKKPEASSSTETSISAPSHGCPYIFKYEQLGGQYIGHVISPQDGLKDAHWQLTFMTRGVGQPGTISEMTTYPTGETNSEPLRDIGRAESYVRFEGYQGVLPRIVSVKLNGQVLCTSSEYEKPYTTVTHGLHITLPRYISLTTTKPPSFKPTSVTSARIDLTSVKIQDPAPEDCGVEGLGFLQIGGENVNRGDFPWLAALYVNNNLDKTGNLQYSCVTTLISKRTVITAAHCIHGIPTDRLWVYVGRHDLHTHPENNATLMSVKSVLTPPDFSTNPQPDLDVGLLVLTNPVQYSIYVRPICLWSITRLRIDDTLEGTVAGWGFNEKLQNTRFPMKVDVRLVSRSVCRDEMPTARELLTPRTVCAGNNQRHGPCLGDSGGGLMVLRNNRWMVRGIVSKAQRAGHGCDLSKYVIYCDVASHLSWIEQNVVR